MDKIEVETQNNTSASETKIDISDNMKEHGEEIEKIQSKTKDDIFVKTEMHRKSIHQIFVSQYMDNTEYGSDDYIVTYSKKDKSVLGWSIKENGPQPDVYFKIDEIKVETQNNTSTSETKIDISDNMKEHGEEIEKTPSETKDDTFEKHRKSISQILVPLCINEEYGSDDYVVTHSDEDRSVLGWSVNIENNGPQQPDVYFKVDQIDIIYTYPLQTLSKKILLFRSKDNWLIDLNSDRTSSDRFLKLKHQVDYATIGFLPNGDLIQVSLGDRKIYKYCFTDKPKNTVPWKYSQIIDIKVPESLNGQIGFECSIYRTKLFLVVDHKMLQFDLFTMNLERKYPYVGCQITMNKNKTLLATQQRIINMLFAKTVTVVTHIYSMENGMLIYENEDSGYGEYGVQFITLKNTERLFIYHDHGGVSKLVDPYQVYDEIVISDGFNGKTNVITKLNKKIFIENGNETHMLNEIIDQVDIKKVISRENDEVEINKNLWIKSYSSTNGNIISFKHDKRTTDCRIPYILSFKLLNNQDLVLISMNGIIIFTTNEDGMRTRYFWNNNEWNDIYEKFREERGEIYDNNFMNKHYKPLIGRILKNEFDDSKHSIPLPKFIDGKIVKDVINHKFVSLKFETEMLKIAIKKKCHDAVRQFIGLNQGFSENYMTIISLNLVELCDYYPDYIITYILRTSIMLSPYCNSIGNSKNTSLHSYTDIYIKGLNMENSYFKPILAIYKGLIQYLRIKEEIQT
ncbi:hypothetical protein RhiirA4_471419, partial [Rhizophagus irregularis]